MANLHLGKTSVSSLLWRLSIPSMTGLLANALYLLINGMFIGKFIGSEAFAGVTIAYPVQMILFSFTLLFGTGANALFSIASGEKDSNKVKSIVVTTVLGSFVTLISISLITFIFLEPILVVFGGRDAILQYALDYMILIIPFFIFQGMAIVYENLIRASGNSIVPMLALIASAILNVALGFLFIPVLKMGVAGAALATGLAEIAAFLIDFLYVKFKCPVLNVPLRPKGFSFKVYRDVCISGFSAFGNQLAFSFRAFLLNNAVLATGGNMALIMVGVITRLDSFLIIPVFGLVHGMRPIVGYAYGSRSYERIKECLKLGLISATVFLSLMWGFVLLFSESIMKFFVDDPVLIKYGGPVLIITHSFIFIIGLNIVGATFFQSLRRNGLAFFFSVVNQLVIFMPLVLIAQYMGLHVNFIWGVYPVTDIITAFLLIFALILVMKNLKKELAPKIK